MTRLRPKRWARRAMLAGIAAVVLYFLPLFRVVPLESARQQAVDASFDSQLFVETFWHQRLLEADASAVDAAHLIKALRDDPAAAGRLGRRLGLGRTVCFFVSGTGEILSIESDAVSIRIEGHPDEAGVIIETGPVFGNAIRDGSGLLDVSAFSNSQDFNAISTALNRRVEEEVLPAFQDRARIGARVQFLGCAEVDDLADAVPLRIVPIRFEWPLTRPATLLLKRAGSRTPTIDETDTPAKTTNRSPADCTTNPKTTVYESSIPPLKTRVHAH